MQYNVNCKQEAWDISYKAAVAVYDYVSNYSCWVVCSVVCSYSW